MKTTTTSASALATAPVGPSLVEDAHGALTEGFEHFCLMAGIESLTQMMNEDVARLAGDRYEPCSDKPGCRWGHAKSQAGFHGGKVEVDRPRLRSKATGREMALPSWEEISAGGYLDQWAVTLMGMNMATRRFGRAVRLPGKSTLRVSSRGRQRAPRRCKPCPTISSTVQWIPRAATSSSWRGQGS